MLPWASLNNALELDESFFLNKYLQVQLLSDKNILYEVFLGSKWTQAIIYIYKLI